MTYQANGLPVAAPTITLRRSLAAATIAVTAGLLAPACADNESSLFISYCIPRTSLQGACSTPAPDDADSFLPSGQLDLAYLGSYRCALLVGNQVVNQGSGDQIRTETSRISLYAADVRLTDLAGNAITYADGSAVEYSVPISGFVDPGGGSDGDAGYGYADVLMIDTATGEALGRQLAQSGGSVDVLASVIVYGRTLGGQELETPEWNFSVRVCIGCACKLCDTQTAEMTFGCGTDEALDCNGSVIVPDARQFDDPPITFTSCNDRIVRANQYYSGL